MTDAPAAETQEPTDTQELKGTGYELFLLLVSFLTIVNTLIVLVPFGGPISQVALLIDALLAPVFVFDFAYRLKTAPSRPDYLLRRWGWADALAMVPVLGVFRVFRAVRVIRLLRVRGRRQVGADLDRGRAAATFFLTLFLVVVVVEFAGMAIYVVESPVAGATIRDASDAVWWGFVTITTVGYGDTVPVTDLGRLIGVLLLFSGVALFSVLTGFIANAFLAPRRRRLARLAAGQVLATPEAEVAELRRLLEEQEDHAAAVRRKLEDVERSLASRSAGPGHP